MEFDDGNHDEDENIEENREDGDSENVEDRLKTSKNPVLSPECSDLSGATKVSRDTSTQTNLNIPANLIIPEGENVQLEFVFKKT